MKDDTISRAAALTALNGCTEIYLNNLPPTIYKEDAIKAVKAQPPATDTNVATTDTISRKAAIDLFEKYGAEDDAVALLESLPSAESELENKIRAIGYTGQEGRIYIGGRLFAVRELPQ